MTQLSASVLQRFFSLAAAGAAFSLAACGGAVTAGGGSGGSGGGGGDDCAGADCTTVSTSVGEGGASSTTVGQGGAGGAVGSSAIALLFSELPGSPGSGSATSSVTGGSTIDPNRLEVFIGGQTFACNDPFTLDCGGEWMVSFSLPVAYQQPGTYDLGDPELNTFASETGTEPGPECSFGGGSFWGGTVQITSIDANQVVGTLSGTDMIWSFSVDGDFVAPRCF